MSLAWSFYISTVLVYLGVDIMACWGLNLQYGYTGILNFSFIIYQSAGAYTAAVLTLGPATSGSFQQYIGGANLPFPLPIIAGGIAGGLLSAVVGVIALRRLRSDYQAMVFLVISLIATAVVTNAVGLFNGPAGLSIIPQPLSTALNLSLVGYRWFYVGLTAAICLIVYAFLRLITSAPLGRSLRAVRDHEQGAAALGKNVTGLRMTSFIVGGVIAGISGAVLVEFISAWSPGGWLYQETFVFFTALIVGGTANNAGAALGALLVPVAFLEGTRFLPQFGPPGLIDALQWIAVGLLSLIFLWFWPRGVLPERRRIIPLPGLPQARTGLQRPGREDGRDPMTSVQRQRATPAGQAELLRVDDLAKSYGGVHAVAGVSFDVPRGGITGLIGPNGAGKSTALGMIAGAIKPSHGSVLLNGTNVAGWPSYKIARRGLARTFQRSSDFPGMTVTENLLTARYGQRGDTLRGALLGRRYWRAEQEGLIARAADLIARFDMARMANELAGTLSGGQRRLLEIMRALMTEPEILLLDEPMAGVNPALGERIEDYLLQLRQDGLTMLMVEHEMSVVERLCDPIIVMAQGEVLAEGTMDQIRSDQRVLDAYLNG